MERYEEIWRDMKRHVERFVERIERYGEIWRDMERIERYGEIFARFFFPSLVWQKNLISSSMASHPHV